MTEEILNVMESVGQSKTDMVRVRDNLSSLMNYLHTFVTIVNDFQKVLLCACAIKIHIISQFPTPTVCLNINSNFKGGTKNGGRSK